ncbi:hypothetical protein P4475_09390 [Halalkalibacterium halodurans]|uniref:hypothetical protein n=1 Tax=Halalkalibacterium halodurans TaxID=86665 RepID=UPI002E1AB1D6|nr:hypothetical protein [Halalkalibacterium halodurans]MED4161793.1 hypothetical protein [Halalkalibacterium halodurans]
MDEKEITKKRAKQIDAKNVNYALIIGICMSIGFAALMLSIFLLDTDLPKEEKIIVTVIVSIVTVPPAIILHIYRTKVWLKRYPQLKKANRKLSGQYEEELSPDSEDNKISEGRSQKNLWEYHGKKKFRTFSIIAIVAQTIGILIAMDGWPAKIFALVIQTPMAIGFLYLVYKMVDKMANKAGE